MQGSAQLVRRIGPGAARLWWLRAGNAAQRGKHRNQRGEFLRRGLTPQDVDRR